MRPIKIFLIVLVGLACGVGLIFAYNKVSQKMVFGIPGASTAPGSVFIDAVAAPDRLLIPKIGVDAHIKSVGVDANGDMATPGNPTDVAWYKYGPHPGMTGSAVINGHLNTKDVPQAVFYNLKQLQEGDEIQVRAIDGQVVTFKVTSVKSYAQDAVTDEIFKRQGNLPYLSLITCSGDWDAVKKVYSDRIVIFAERVQ